MGGAVWEALEQWEKPLGFRTLYSSRKRGLVGDSRV